MPRPRRNSALGKKGKKENNQTQHIKEEQAHAKNKKPVTDDEEDEEDNDEEEDENEDENESNDDEPKVTHKKRKQEIPEPETSSSPFIYIIIVALGSVVLFYLLPSFSSPPRINSQPLFNYSKIDFTPLTSPSAIDSLKGFHQDLLLDKELRSRQHAKVMELDTTPEKRVVLYDLINKLFSSQYFDVVLLDGEIDTSLSPNFFVNYDENKPLLVLVKNIEKSSQDFRRSFGSSLANNLLRSLDGKHTRSPHNVGFLFISSSVLNEESCNKMDVVDHYYQKLKWTSSFITRINEHVKVC